MTGKDLRSTAAGAIVAGLRAQGITTCFTNPGTTELSLVTALAAESRVRTILSLFEGVCTGAADGFFRVSRSPAATLLHLGPGLANGLANLHNARRAGSGIVNLVGEIASWHRPHDPPLASDIVGLASTVGWHSGAHASASSLVAAVVHACERAKSPQAAIATVPMPMDLLEQAVPNTPPATARYPSSAANYDAVDAAIESVVSALALGKTCLLYLAGDALSVDVMTAAERLRAHTGCQVLTEMFPPRMERGVGLPWFRSVPYFPETAASTLGRVEAIVAIGGPEPITMFGSPGLPSHPVPATASRIRIDAEAGCLVLREVADRLGAGKHEFAPLAPLTLPTGPNLTADIAGEAVCALLPEGAIVVAEAGTSLRGYLINSPRAARHLLVSNSGGAIGMGLCAAVGAAVAAPDRRVVALQADGSALYTPQALWTMAREGLDVTVVLYSNHSYRILQHELQRAGSDAIDTGLLRALTTLDQPTVDWVALGAALGVQATRPSSVDEFNADLRAALAAPGPSMIVVDEPPTVGPLS